MSRTETAAQARSLDAIFEDFEPQGPLRNETPKYGAPITFWVPLEYKGKYDRIQERSRKRFCKKVRELILAAIDRCDPEAAAS